MLSRATSPGLSPQFGMFQGGAIKDVIPPACPGDRNVPLPRKCKEPFVQRCEWIVGHHVTLVQARSAAASRGLTARWKSRLNVMPPIQTEA